MKATVEAMKKAGVRDRVKVMIGGAPMDEAVSNYIGADAFGLDATAAVRLAKSWMGGM
jgi:5-methyltetrahydrofolate--homocysteine methyltransferase